MSTGDVDASIPQRHTRTREFSGATGRRKGRHPSHSTQPASRPRRNGEVGGLQPQNSKHGYPGPSNAYSGRQRRLSGNAQRSQPWTDPRRASHQQHNSMRLPMPVVVPSNQAPNANSPQGTTTVMTVEELARWAQERVSLSPSMGSTNAAFFGQPLHLSGPAMGNGRMRGTKRQRADQAPERPLLSRSASGPHGYNYLHGHQRQAGQQPQEQNAVSGSLSAGAAHEQKRTSRRGRSRDKQRMNRQHQHVQEAARDAVPPPDASGDSGADADYDGEQGGYNEQDDDEYDEPVYDEGPEDEPPVLDDRSVSGEEQEEEHRLDWDDHEPGNAQRMRTRSQPDSPIWNEESQEPSQEPFQEPPPEHDLPLDDQEPDQRMELQQPASARARRGQRRQNMRSSQSQVQQPLRTQAAAGRGPRRKKRKVDDQIQRNGPGQRDVPSPRNQQGQGQGQGQGRSSQSLRQHDHQETMQQHHSAAPPIPLPPPPPPLLQQEQQTRITSDPDAATADGSPSVQTRRRSPRTRGDVSQPQAQTQTQTQAPAQMAPPADNGPQAEPSSPIRKQKQKRKKTVQARPRCPHNTSSFLMKISQTNSPTNSGDGKEETGDDSLLLRLPEMSDKTRPDALATGMSVPAHGLGGMEDMPIPSADLTRKHGGNREEEDYFPQPSPEWDTEDTLDGIDGMHDAVDADGAN